MHRHSFVTIGCLVLAISITRAVSAKPPWQLISFRSVKADAKADYQLAEEHGPWLIFATSFAGEGAETEAKRLVHELRKRYKLPAYVHRKNFDFTGRLEGIGINQDRSPKRMKYEREGVVQEVAVLVGNYESLDDPALPKTLKRIKYARPECLSKNPDSTTRRFAKLREFHKKINGNEEKRRKGPMGSAFAVRNPIIPREFFAPKGIDQLVLKMNKGVQHSLLDCPAKYTVRIATFRGNVIIDQKRVEDIERGTRKMRSRLEQAALDAHKLTMKLRQKGIKAYEFHDRHESYVTVGHFDWVGRTPGEDGKQQMNPAIVEIIRRYGPVRQPVTDQAGQSLAGIQPRTFEGIPFDVQPWPVEVPRRSIATDYVRNR